MRFLLMAMLLALALPAWSQGKKPTAKPGTRKPVSGFMASMQSGKAVYRKYCLTCHQADGSGVPYLNPSLIRSTGVAGSKSRLIGIVLKGLSGKEIEGNTYSNVMPNHAFLSDRQVADVLTYIRRSFGNRASPVSPAEVKAVRSKK